MQAEISTSVIKVGVGVGVGCLWGPFWAPGIGSSIIFLTSCPRHQSCRGTVSLGGMVGAALASLAFVAATVCRAGDRDREGHDRAWQTFLLRLQSMGAASTEVNRQF